VPLLVAAGNQVVAAIGTMGGRAQPQILLQILRSALSPDQALEQTLAAPRWVTGARDIDFDTQTVALEAHADDAVEAALAAAGVPVVRIPRHDERVGHAQVVRVAPAGLEAASDPRSDGEAGIA
jgi:gamma-glutamyltranspeptidase